MAIEQYIGITLGPISRIMSYTQSTKSLWGASYFMSYLGKELITDFFDEKHPFLKPQLDKIMWTIRDGVGRFPDQYIFGSQNGDFIKLLRIREETLKKLGHEIALTLKIEASEEQKVIDYLKNTIKIYIYEMNEWDSSRSVVEQCQEALNAMECQDCYPVREQKNYLASYFEKIHKDSLLLKDAIGQLDSNQRLFSTIIEHSASEAVEAGLLRSFDLFDDEKIKSLPTAYKYIAFVAADGDNIGKALGKLGNKMSNLLLKYNQEIVKAVNAKNGQVIYAGGDDLLLFAPINSIFHLIENIDRIFNDTISSSPEIMKELEEKKLPVPTLSFGLSISYYKHPMSESLQLAEDLLEEAKNNGRNRIVWNMRKHSGQSVKSSFFKGHAELFPTAIQLIDKFQKQNENLKGTCQENKDNDTVFLHSISHYLLQHREILHHILSEGTPAQIATELRNYMDSTFNDDEHEKHKESLESFRAYLQSIAISEGKNNEAVKKLHALLRFIELLISKKEELI